MTPRTWLHGMLLVTCLSLVTDQHFFVLEERSTYLGQHVLRQERPKARGLYRWRRWNEKPGPQLGSRVHAELWRVAVLENGRWFQFHQRDNGVMQAGDTVRIEVAPFTGRVLRFQPQGTDRERESVDAFADIAPIPILLTPMLLWLLFMRSGTDRYHYLHYTALLFVAIFLLSLFALAWPTLELLGWT
jgi:hypothetical protein